MSKFLFVGEKRSDRAIALGLTWEDGGLAAKQLFDALLACFISPETCHFTNWFERGGKTKVQRCAQSGFLIIAMGRKVQMELDKRQISHRKLIHPAARGSIRRKDRYLSHVRDVLCASDSANTGEREELRDLTNEKDGG
jgi:hypothetical protein